MTILIVDDNQPNLYQLQVLLGGNGYQVVTAANGAEALAKARQNPPDLIISDILMPVMDGFALCREWQKDERLRQIPFVFYTATYTDERDRELALSLGAARFLVKPADPDAFLQMIREVLANHGQGSLLAPCPPVEDEAAYLKQYNEALIRKLEAKMQQLEVANGSLQRDIAELKRAEERIREQARLIDLAQDIIIVRDLAGRIQFANPAAERLSGWTLAEVQGRCIGELAYRDPAQFDTLTRQLLATGTWQGEVAIVTKSGQELIFHSRSTLLRDAQGKPQSVLSISTDVTEHKQAEQKLREAETRYHALFELSPDGIVIIDPETTRLLEFNETACRQLGYSREEFAPLCIADIDAVETPEETRTRIRSVLREGRNDFETRQRTRQGEIRYVHVTAQIIEVLGRPVYHCIWRDVTEQKKLEAQFLRAQRLEGVGALASGVAHDLNNVLAPVLMIAPLLRDTVQDADSRAMLDTVESCARRGADIIKQLLIFARGTPGARVPLPIGHLLRDMEKIIRETFPRDIRPVVDSPEDLWLLPGDPTQIHQVLVNLCVNARDAMPDGGTLTLKARNVDVDVAFAAMTPDARPGPYLRVSVADTGTGIAPEDLERIFDPFFTTKEIGKGTGLGLATVLGIVRGHGGFVCVDSKLGHGATFDLHFPALPEARTASPPARGTPPPRGQGELILVVDDEASVREAVRHILESHGYRVVIAAQGAEGLAVYFQHAAEIRAVLTDMMMPIMNGPAMITALRQAEPRLVILGMTGLPERTGVKGLESLDLPALLTKPFSGDALLGALHSAIHRSGATAAGKGPEPA